MEIHATFEIQLSEADLRSLLGRRAARARTEAKKRARSRSPLDSEDNPSRNGSPRGPPAGPAPTPAPTAPVPAPTPAPTAPVPAAHPSTKPLPEQINAVTAGPSEPEPLYLPHQTPKSPLYSPYPTAPPSPRASQPEEEDTMDGLGEEQLLGEDPFFQETDQQFYARLSRQLEDLEKRMNEGRYVNIKYCPGIYCKFIYC